MQYNREKIIQASLQAGCSREQSERIWALLQQDERKSNRLLKAGYFLGALLLFISSIWFWEQNTHLYGKNGFFVISLLYTVILYAVGMALKSNALVREICIFLSAASAPLAVYSYLWMNGKWDGSMREDWFIVEIITLVVAVGSLWAFRFVTLLPIAFTALWGMCWSVWPSALQETYGPFSSMFCGISLLMAGYLVHKKGLARWTFWSYLCGATALWSGLWLQESSSEWAYSMQCIAAIGFIVAGVVSKRLVFLGFGSFGLIMYLTSLLHRVFPNATLFPLVLALIGAAMIGAGLFWHRSSTRNT